MVMNTAKMLCLLMGAVLLVSARDAEAQGGADTTAEVKLLLDRFRQIGWDSRAVGTNKNLADDAWKTRVEVENRLIALGAEAVPALIAACADANRHVRYLAAYCLGVTNDMSAAPELIRMVQSETDAPVRLMAVEALGRLGAKTAASVVQTAAEKDSSVHVRNAAQWALPRVREGRGVGDSLRREVIDGFDMGKVGEATVGQPAPDFTLMDGNRTVHHLSDYKGKKNIVLVFMLADW